MQNLETIIRKMYTHLKTENDQQMVKRLIVVKHVLEVERDIQMLKIKAYKTMTPL